MVLRAAARFAPGSPTGRSRRCTAPATPSGRRGCWATAGACSLSAATPPQPSASCARARDLFAREGATAAVLAHELQLARVAWLRGDLPACMAQLDAAERRELAPADAAELELLRAQTLAAAQLWTEARESLARARAYWRRHARDDHGGRLEAIRLTLLGGDAGSARASHADAALLRGAGSRAARRPRGGPRARGGDRGRRRLARGDRSGRRAAATLTAAGWSAEARRVQLAVARAAIELGAVRTAERELAACAPLFRRGPIDDRIEAWHIEARVRLAAGDLPGARRAARRGLAVLEEYRAVLGAADLRATASSIGSELAALGLRIALPDRRPGTALEWAEALRGECAAARARHPAAQSRAAGSVTELRQLTAEVARRERAGRSPRSLLARQARVETQVRRLSRHAPGEAVPSRARPTPAELARGARRPRAGRVRRVRRGAVGADARGRPLAPPRARPLRTGARSARVAAVRAHAARAPARRAPQRESLTAGAVASAAAVEEALLGPVADVIGGGASWSSCRRARCTRCRGRCCRRCAGGR